MQLWPAIDLRDGKCVRLQQGDYGRETVFAPNPSEVARRFVQLGAKRLHLVDLDGARDGRLVNAEAIREIVATAGVPCQLGGGIRDEETIDSLLTLGLSRLVIGTQAVKQPDWFRQMCQRHPGRLCLGIDARDGMVATDGWLETSEMAAVELAVRMRELPLAAVIYTDIARDGMLAGVNLPAMAEMKQRFAGEVVASGGVTSLDDVRSLSQAGLDGCIVGRALYEGRLQLEPLLAVAGEAP